MDNKLITSVVSIALAIIGVAVVAVLVSKQAQTTGVVSAFSKAFSGSLSCALSPVIGGGNCGTSSSSTISFS